MRKSIVLSAPEVAAILAGATQVRVPVRLPKWASTMFHLRNDRLEVMRNYGLEPPIWEPVPCPYSVDSVLAVREPFVQWITPDGRADWSRSLLYKADDPEASDWWIGGQQMPAKLARLHLRVLDVLAQRVAYITDAEALSCGLQAMVNAGECEGATDTSVRGCFVHHWRKRHGSAEWCWVLRVERTEVGRG